MKTTKTFFALLGLMCAITIANDRMEHTCTHEGAHPPVTLSITRSDNALGGAAPASVQNIFNFRAVLDQQGITGANLNHGEIA